MTFSLNEVVAIAKKAARGAGYSWGLAEEAGVAVRWLSMHGFDGCAALASLLERMDGATLPEHGPQLSQDVWCSKHGAMCALMAGTAFADRASLHGDGEVVMRNVVAPLMFVPFVADVARMTGRPVRMRWTDTDLVTDGVDVSGDAGSGTASDVLVSFGAAIGPPRATKTRVAPKSLVWAVLNTFAERTYAPATEASRLKGAGAGVSDND